MIIFYKDSDLWLGWTEESGIISVHTEIYAWSLSKYKKYLVVFGSFLNTIKAPVVYSVAKTEKAKKFNELFGFSILKEESGVYTMKLEVAYV